MALTKVGAGVLNIDDLYGFRNRVINGDFRIFQRAQSATGITTTGYFTADRARTSMFGAGTSTVDNEVLLNQNVAGNIMNVFKSVVTTTNSARSVRYNQRIEPSNFMDMSGKTVTLSFFAKADSELTLNDIFLGDNGTGNLTPIELDNVNLTTSWQKITRTAFLDDTTTSEYLDLVIGLFGGTSNLTSATWYITGIQLELGTVATPFERRPFGMELALCQRYFVSLKYPNDSRIGAGHAIATTTALGARVNFPVEMRATPSITLPPVSISNGITYLLSADAYPTIGSAFSVIQGASQIGFSIRIQNYTGGFSAGDASTLYATGNQVITASSEL